MISDMLWDCLSDMGQARKLYPAAYGPFEQALDRVEALMGAMLAVLDTPNARPLNDPVNRNVIALVQAIEKVDLSGVDAAMKTVPAGSLAILKGGA